MRLYLQAVCQTIVKVSSHELAGGLLVGLILSLAASGIWMLVRKKLADPLPALCGLILAVSGLSMAFGLGHSHYQAEILKYPPWASGPNPRGDAPPPASLGRRLLQDADANRDGRLTPEEAAQFVRDADHLGKGWVGIPEIDRTHRDIVDQRSPQGDHTDSDRRPSRRERF